VLLIWRMFCRGGLVGSGLIDNHSSRECKNVENTVSYAIYH
jgi:hypothetical protein